MMDFLYQAIFGLIVGIIAKFLMPGKDPGGCIITAILGVCGSVLFTYLSRTFFAGRGETWHWCGAILGTMLILLIYRLIFGGKK